MCSAQKLHTYTDFEIDKQYFFSAFSQLHEVFLKYDTFASNCCANYTKHDGFPSIGSESFMVWQSDKRRKKGDRD